MDLALQYLILARLLSGEAIAAESEGDRPQNSEFRVKVRGTRLLSEVEGDAAWGSGFGCAQPAGVGGDRLLNSELRVKRLSDRPQNSEFRVKSQR